MSAGTAPAREEERAPAAAPELSVVLPCLNESETLGECIRQIRAALEQGAIEAEVIVADNGSHDGSAEIARSMGATVVPVERKGYGSALLGGISQARGKFILMGDSDGQHDFSQIGEFVRLLREGYDIVIGNRFRGGLDRSAMPALNRYLGNPVLSGLGRLFFKSPCGDFHCGLRAFRKDAFERMGLRTLGMEFASEMVVKATLLRLKMAEIPTKIGPHGRSRAPHLRPFHDGWRHLRFMLLYSPRWLFFYPGALLMLGGIGVGLWLIPGPRVVRGVVVDVHTLVYAAAAVFIGFQAIAFAVFTKIFAVTEGLLPEDPRLPQIFRAVDLQLGLLFGFVLVVLGLGGSIYSFQTIHAMSASGGFGLSDARVTLRMIVPATLALTLGCETILASLFLSVLGLARK